MAVRYALLHIRRNRLKSVAILLVSLTFVALILALCAIQDSQQRRLEDTLATLPVPAIVTDIYGARSDHLALSEVYIDGILRTDSKLAPYIQFPSVRRGLDCRLSDASGVLLSELTKLKLIGTTGLSSDPMFSADNGINLEYFAGYDESVWLGQEKVCFVNEKLFVQLGDGVNSIHVDFSELVEQRKMDIEVGAKAGVSLPGGEDVDLQELKIAGIIHGGSPSNILCPWEIVHSVDQRIYGYPTADAAAFLVADNRKINELKDILPIYFSKASPDATVNPLDPPAPALVIHDATLVRVVSPIERNIQFITVILPILLALSLGIGFLTSYLHMRTRLTEFALMRSLGTQKAKVFLSAIFEQGMLSGVGVALGLIAAALLSALSIRPLAFCALFFIYFVTGACIAAARLVSVNVMDTMKTVE